MRHRYCVHPFKCVVAASTCLLCTVVSIALICSGQGIQAIPFCAIGLLFLGIGLLYGSIVTIDSAGVHRKIACLPSQTLLWSEIAEIGVVGLKVFNNNDPQRTGSRYIYFSPHALDEAGRFRLALEWPPRHMPYLSFSQERLVAVQQLWSRTIQTYNAGEIFF